MWSKLLQSVIKWKPVAQSKTEDTNVSAELRGARHPKTGDRVRASDIGNTAGHSRCGEEQSKCKRGAPGPETRRHYTHRGPPLPFTWGEALRRPAYAAAF